MKKLLILLLVLWLSACEEGVWNSPRPLDDYRDNVRYGTFSVSPKTLDPAAAYTTDSTLLLSQIYEPPLQYHYLKRPYTLVPLTAAHMPVVRYWDRQGRQLPTDALAEDISFTTYDITIQPNIFYQPHPAFARSREGQDLQGISTLSDFPDVGTRELVAQDYVYQIKRFAHPLVSSPILEPMSRYILGLTEYEKTLRKAYDRETNPHAFFDLRKYPLRGVQVIDKYTYRITLMGKYQQFLYWLAMSFFAPIPWEADAFYSQPGMAERNLNFNWQPVGTGAYYLIDNNPNKQMVLQKNPYFHLEYFPTEGMPGDREQGYLQDAGKKLPFIDRYVFTLEKEVVPRWSKFLQGYYDQSYVSADMYGEAIQLDRNGRPHLSPFLRQKGIRLQTSSDPSVFYFAFNMLDEVVGGYSESARKIRQAIGMVLDQSEYSAIFLNGRGIESHGPLPEGIFGYIPASPAKRKSVTAARQLLAEAGYPNGRNQITGEPLRIRFDATSSSPADQNRFIWVRKQFEKLGITLDVDVTDFNRLQEKMRHGDTQFFMYGWSADYPDPENFLFLLYGPNGQVQHGGVNASNYENEAYDRLFEQMRHMPNDVARFKVIQDMIAILKQDAPWAGALFTESLLLSQAWLVPAKPSAVQNNVLKYERIDPQQRMVMIQQWNRPILWPAMLIFFVLLLLVLPAWIGYYLKTHRAIKREKMP